MNRLISLLLALGIVLAAPLYAGAQAGGAGGAGAGAAGGASSGTSGGSSGSSDSAGSAATTGNGMGPATQRMQSGQAGMANPSPGNMATRNHPKNGLSRNKSDCAKTGCIDSGGN